MHKPSEFNTGHHDRVTVLATNFTGARILTASIDHRIKVWSRDPKTGTRALIDTFTAHDSDIRDAKFLHPTVGSYIGSIGNDLKFHLWQEDVAAPYNSGRRFRRVTTIPSTPRVPFVSLDVKTVDNVYTYVALIDRQGLLSIYEPSSPDEFKDWVLVDQFNVCGTNPPQRGDETSFKVRFDQNVTPLAYVNSLSDDRNQLSLVVSALNEIKIYRSVVPSGEVDSGDGASHQMMFYEAKSIKHPVLVRDVAWAPFSVRGTDRIATAGKDGSVRIFELAVAEAPGVSNGQNPSNASTIPSTTKLSTQTPRQQPQSSLTSAITGRAQTQSQSQYHSHSHSTSGSSGPGQASHPTNTTSRSAHPGDTFPFLTSIQSVSELSHAHPDAWSVTFDSQGQVLLTNGSDGMTKIWRKSVLGGQWLVFAGQQITESDDDDSDEGDEDSDGNDRGRTGS